MELSGQFRGLLRGMAIVFSGMFTCSVYAQQPVQQTQVKKNQAVVAVHTPAKSTLTSKVAPCCKASFSRAKMLSASHAGIKPAAKQ